jgi:hypothetical protein
MNTCHESAKRHQTRWFATAVAVPVVAFALAATAYVGGKLPADQDQVPAAGPAAVAQR